MEKYKNRNNGKSTMKEFIYNNGNPKNTLSMDNIRFHLTNNQHPEETLEKDKVKRINLRSWGFKSAGNNKGNLNSLRNELHRIYNNYLNEIAGKQNHQTVEIKRQIEDTKADINNTKTNISRIEDSEVQELQKEIEDLQGDIEKTRIDAEKGFVSSDFNWVKTILDTVISFVLGLGIIFFYTSLIYNGLFKDITATMINSNIDNSEDLFNTLLDVNSLFAFNNTGIFLSYMFSSLFLAMGLLLHNKPEGKSLWQKIGHWTKKIALLIVALGAEIVFAYKIEKTTNEIKSITLSDVQVAQSWKEILLSEDVFIVIILGFIAYLIWSFTLEATFKEWNKRNPEKLAEVTIREIEKKIKRRKYRISEFKKQVIELKGILKSLEQNLETLQRKLNQIFFQPVELEERLETFFNGWLRYVNNHEDLTNEVKQHEAVFVEIKNKLLNNKTDDELHQ